MTEITEDETLTARMLLPSFSAKMPPPSRREAKNRAASLPPGGRHRLAPRRYLPEQRLEPLRTTPQPDEVGFYLRHADFIHLRWISSRRTAAPPRPTRLSNLVAPTPNAKLHACGLPQAFHEAKPHFTRGAHFKTACRHFIAVPRTATHYLFSPELHKLYRGRTSHRSLDEIGRTVFQFQFLK